MRDLLNSSVLKQEFPLCETFLVYQSQWLMCLFIEWAKATTCFICIQSHETRMGLAWYVLIQEENPGCR